MAAFQVFDFAHELRRFLETPIDTRKAHIRNRVYLSQAFHHPFADGHSEIRKWISATSKLPVRFVYFPVPLDPAGKLDLQWCLERTGYIDARTGKPAYGY